MPKYYYKCPFCQSERVRTITVVKAKMGVVVLYKCLYCKKQFNSKQYKVIFEKERN